MLETFRLSSKLLNTFIGHTTTVWSVDYSTFDDCQFICSGSHDNTVRVWDVDNNKQIQSFNGHSSPVYCVKFSSYHYHNNRQHVICSSSSDKTIRIWNFKHNKQLQIFSEHRKFVVDIYALYLLTKQFVYGILKHQNHYMFLMDMKILFGVLIFHHYKVIITIITMIIIIK
ncbi:hypothetical protein RFI_35562 [Reticulomyxa filosa]|uniref:Uncharacterized protein n=1 Tax=Reticulomyxa filosa TaxID=46433 RepID=X6LL89_RETFI|nr:hypothetical protein RFI_35562 [Reticulomyxa filosa]|eukprot:ETO01877.1 hypothetical protein RFI_35562 [Reticulomyxa filosa]